MEIDTNIPAEYYPDGIILTDKGGCITYVNTTAQFILGRSLQTLKGRDLADYIPAAIVAERRGSSTNNVYTIRGKGNSIHVDVRSTTSPDGGTVVRLTNITSEHETRLLLEAECIEKGLEIDMLKAKLSLLESLPIDDRVRLETNLARRNLLSWLFSALFIMLGCAVYLHSVERPLPELWTLLSALFTVISAVCGYYFAQNNIQQQNKPKPNS